MATTAMDYENANGDRFDGKLFYIHAANTHHSQETSSTPTHTPGIHKNILSQMGSSANMFGSEDAPRYDRDRSASPRRDDGHDSSRRRSMSPNGHDRYARRIPLTTSS